MTFITHGTKKYIVIKNIVRLIFSVKLDEIIKVIHMLQNKRIVKRNHLPPILYVGKAMDKWINGFRINGPSEGIKKKIKHNGTPNIATIERKLIHIKIINMTNPAKACFPIIVVLTLVYSLCIPTTIIIIERNRNIPIKYNSSSRVG